MTFRRPHANVLGRLVPNSLPTGSKAEMSRAVGTGPASQVLAGHYYLRRATHPRDIYARAQARGIFDSLAMATSDGSS